MRYYIVVLPFLSKNQCHILRNFKPVILFRLGYNIILTTICYNFVTNKENPLDNGHNTQPILLSFKAYKFGAPGTGFIITPTFVRPGVPSNVPYLY